MRAPRTIGLAELLIKPDLGNYACSDVEKASLLNSCFCSIIANVDNKLSEFELVKLLNEKLSLRSINFTEFSVAYKIKKLDNSCFPGYVSPQLLCTKKA